MIYYHNKYKNAHLTATIFFDISVIFICQFWSLTNEIAKRKSKKRNTLELEESLDFDTKKYGFNRDLICKTKKNTKHS